MTEKVVDFSFHKALFEYVQIRDEMAMTDWKRRWPRSVKHRVYDFLGMKRKRSWYSKMKHKFCGFLGIKAGDEPCAATAEKKWTSSANTRGK